MVNSVSTEYLVVVVFSVLVLWLVICLPSLYYFYTKGKLHKIYDMVILLSLCASMFLTMFSVMLEFIIKVLF